MNKSQQQSMVAKVMAIPGMDLTHDASYQVDESPARDLHRTHFRFTSDLGVADGHNGNTFAKFMSSHNVIVEQRRPKMVVIANTDLERVFKL